MVNFPRRFGEDVFISESIEITLSYHFYEFRNKIRTQCQYKESDFSNSDIFSINGSFDNRAIASPRGDLPESREGLWSLAWEAKG